MQSFINAIKGHALEALSNKAFSCEIGRITSYDPSTRLVIVEIHPATEDDPSLITGWIPLGTPWAGNGWGLYAAPALNTLCTVLFQQGSNQQPIAATPLFDGSNAPLAVDSKEFWIVHESGSSIKFTNDGNVLISSSTQIDLQAPTINITASSECKMTAPNVTVEASVECDITAPIVKAGAAGGVFTPLLKENATSTLNLLGS